MSVASMLLAYDAGIRDFGENRAQELVSKRAEMPDDCVWHMIGAVQTNKVRRLASCVSLWHTVDREALVLELALRAPDARVMVEVNVGNEPHKPGCRIDDLDTVIGAANDAGLAVLGLMCVPPINADPRDIFQLLAQSAHQRGLVELSMGMTSDFELAVECGATMVRVGSAIFGPRPTIADARN